MQPSRGGICRYMLLTVGYNDEHRFCVLRSRLALGVSKHVGTDLGLFLWGILLFDCPGRKQEGA